MSNRSTMATYERLIKKIMMEIAMLPKTEEATFKRLKKKANKYLRKYEDAKASL